MSTLGAGSSLSVSSKGPIVLIKAFIVPALYEPYQDSSPKAIDEYTLSQA